MADTVRYLMEEMIPELEDLEKKGYFSRAEVKAIAQRRQDYEYALKRRAAFKRDFLKYIEYEDKLDELRRLRRKERGITGKKGLAEMGSVRRMHFIYERATRKFKADLSLWLAWLEFCKRSKSNKQFSKVVTKALHRHSHEPVVWVEAAAWEFESNANVAAARALMQQGLRHCGRDEGLWAEYLRLELLYVARLRARRAVLGLPNPESAEEIEAPATANNTNYNSSVHRGVKRKRRQAPGDQTDKAAAAVDVDMDAAAATADDDAAAPSQQQQGAAGGEAAVAAVLTGAVARVVIKGAVAAAPTSLSMRTRLLTVLHQFSFPGVSQLQAYLYAGIEADFGGNVEEAWDVLARRHWPHSSDGGVATASTALPHLPPPWIPHVATVTLTSYSSFNGDGGIPAAVDAGRQQHEEGQGIGGIRQWEVDAVLHKACCDVYEAALRALPTPRMHELYLRYLGQRTLPVLRASTATSPASGGEVTAARAAVAADAVAALAGLGAQLLAGYEAAMGARAASELVCVGYVDWAMALGQPKLAVKAGRRGCEAYPHSAAVWTRRVALELELAARRGGGSGSEGGASCVVDVLTAAVQAVPADTGEGLWRLAFLSLPPGAPGHAQLVAALLKVLAGRVRGPVSGGLGGVVGELLTATARGPGGLSAARALLKELLKRPPAGGDMFKAAIQMEIDHAVHMGVHVPPAAAKKGASAANKETAAAIRRLFEAAVDAYGEVDVDLWLRYAAWETSSTGGGAGGGVGSMYWRATKALSDPDAFIQLYRQQQQQRQVAAA